MLISASQLLFLILWFCFEDLLLWLLAEVDHLISDFKACFCFIDFVAILLIVIVSISFWTPNLISFFSSEKSEPKSSKMVSFSPSLSDAFSSYFWSVRSLDYFLVNLILSSSIVSPFKFNCSIKFEKRRNRLTDVVGFLLEMQSNQWWLKVSLVSKSRNINKYYLGEIEDFMLR